MNFTETAMFDTDTENGLRETSDGYVRCRPRVARTGIQIYGGNEVGRPDMQEVRVYRPESEVMHKDAVGSLAGKPVSVEHPPEPITAKNWKRYAVGRLGEDIMRDGEFIRVPLMLMDSAAIDLVRGGKNQLSVGYTAVLRWGDGETPTGEKYNAIQTSIRANHVAITHTARGGDKLRMGDRKKETSMRTLMVDGISIEMEDRDAQHVERRITALEQAVNAAKTTAQNDVALAKTETANATSLVQNKDAEIATLKQQLSDTQWTPERIAKAARERNAVEQRAKALLDSIKIDDTMSDEAIRRQVVNARMGDMAKEWTDGQVSSSFSTLAVVGGGSDLNRVVNVIRNNDTFIGTDQVAAAYKQYDDELTNRWKTAGVRAL